MIDKEFLKKYKQAVSKKGKPKKKPAK